jgi:membrane protease YdiL (CAAX protease family)
MIPMQSSAMRTVPAVGMPSRKEQALEVAVFLFLILPSMLLATMKWQQGAPDFALLATATICRDLALVSLVCFFLWRNGEPVRAIGWTSWHSVRELLLGVVLFVPFFAGAALLEWALLRLGLSAPSTPLSSLLKVHGAGQVVLALFLVSVVAVAEETIFRGYLLLRFKTVFGNTAVAVVLSSAIFAVGHGYEGSAGVVTVGVMGLVFALIYLWRGSLAAPIVMHFLQDFIAIVVAPLLVGK